MTYDPIPPLPYCVTLTLSLSLWPLTPMPSLCGTAGSRVNSEAVGIAVGFTFLAVLFTIGIVQLCCKNACKNSFKNGCEKCKKKGTVRCPVWCINVGVSSLYIYIAVFMSYFLFSFTSFPEPSLKDKVLTWVYYINERRMDQFKSLFFLESG